MERRHRGRHQLMKHRLSCFFRTRSRADFPVGKASHDMLRDTPRDMLRDVLSRGLWHGFWVRFPACFWSVSFRFFAGGLPFVGCPFLPGLLQHVSRLSRFSRGVVAREGRRLWNGRGTGRQSHAARTGVLTATKGSCGPCGLCGVAAIQSIPGKRPRNDFACVSSRERGPWCS